MALNTLEFLRRLLPWPQDDQRGYINVHFAGKAEDGHPWMSGKPTTSPQQFLETVHGVMRWNIPTDIYFCLTRQEHTKTNKAGKIVAAKSHEGAMAAKALWLDMDVGKVDKGGYPTAYSTRDEAATAVEAFRVSVGLPPVSAMVASGGGLHVYWISDRELDPEEWQVYANGLKALILQKQLFGCDAPVTADRARILRVPGTFNRKQEPARPVELLELLDHDYDFAKDLAFLRDVDAGGSVLPAVPTTPRLEGAPLAAFAGLTTEGGLGAGIEREEWNIDLAHVAPQCGFIRTALDTGGADFDNALWNYTTLISTWTTGGREDAHKMARGYPRYSEDETDQLYNRKLAERGNKRLGPPRCTAIQAAGCKACATCPLLSQGKTPLHHVVVPKPEPVRHVDPVRPGLPTAVAALATGLVPLRDADLPPGYIVEDGIICAVAYKQLKGGEEEEFHKPLLLNAVYDPWTQKEGRDDAFALNFTISTDKNNFKQCCLTMPQMEAGVIVRNLLNLGAKPVQKFRAELGAFFVAWINQLHEAGESRQATRLGWVQDPDTSAVTGFCYGGHTYLPDGTRQKAAVADARVRALYTPRGGRDVWMQCCKVITDQRRAGLETLVAAAFASPLMFATGQYNGMLCAVSDSGTQKTSAARTGLAIWQHPKIAKETPKSTAKSALNRMGQTRHLPVLWDEIQDAATNQKMYDTLFEGTLGVEGGRLNSDLHQQHRGDWQLLTMVCTNNSFADYIAQKNPNTSAGLVRVLEWQQTSMALDAPGRMTMIEADNLFGALDDNFGRIGEEFAKILIMNWDVIQKDVVEAVTRVERELDMPPPERNWGATIGVILVAASIANATIGTDFHVSDIRDHLYETVRQNRRRIKAEVHAPDSIDNANDMLTAFLKDQAPFTLITRPGNSGGVEIASHPDHNKGVQVQWDQASKELRISKARFRQWVAVPVDRGGAGLNPRRACETLAKCFGAVELRGQLGVGTTWRAGQEIRIIVPLSRNPDLLALMEALVGNHELPPGATPDNPGGFNAASPAST